MVFRGDCAYQFRKSNRTGIGFSIMNSNSVQLGGDRFSLDRYILYLFGPIGTGQKVDNNHVF
jgi:hypothetical protein